ncbi:DUF6959 family protein [Streptomyces sp. NPDC056944]|uniref:DUF6959 family protein n=1 Tax=Streptomyces sp. NPDC056944 TaxID=3345972 RepID=UPI003627F921
MERIEIELLAPGGNGAVVRMPGRRYPGVVIQGDSLSIMRRQVAELTAACAQGDVDGALDLSQFLLADLDENLGSYEDALARHGIPRPY